MLRTPTGSPETTLVVIRGNSGSGKTTAAQQLRLGYGRGRALVEQDYLRRILLRERDKPGGLAIGLIDPVVRYALVGGYHVFLEGVPHRCKYRPMMEGLAADHVGPAFVFYLDVSLDETLRRHATRPQAAEFTADHIRGWYRDRISSALTANTASTRRRRTPCRSSPGRPG